MDELLKKVVGRRKNNLDPHVIIVAVTLATSAAVRNVLGGCS